MADAIHRTQKTVTSVFADAAGHFPGAINNSGETVLPDTTYFSQ